MKKFIANSVCVAFDMFFWVFCGAALIFTVLALATGEIVSSFEAAWLAMFETWTLVMLFLGISSLHDWAMKNK
jgi:hypothetical protein